MNLIDFVPIPNHWNSQGTIPLQYELHPQNNACEYSYVRNIIKGTICERTLDKIVRIENAYLYGRYLLRKCEYESKPFFHEFILLHSTPAENVPLIIENNLDYRLVARCKFGKGISFSPCASYANREGCRYTNTKERAMIIAKVLVSQSHPGFPFMKLPACHFDTSTDFNNKVFVKYQDDEFYPEYIVYYKDNN